MNKYEQMALESAYRFSAPELDTYSADLQYRLVLYQANADTFVVKAGSNYQDAEVLAWADFMTSEYSKTVIGGAIIQKCEELRKKHAKAMRLTPVAIGDAAGRDAYGNAANRCTLALYAQKNGKLIWKKVENIPSAKRRTDYQGLPEVYDHVSKYSSYGTLGDKPFELSHLKQLPADFVDKLPDALKAQIAKMRLLGVS